MYWKYLSPNIPSNIKLLSQWTTPLYWENIFTLGQFQERRHHEVLPGSCIPASATSCRRANTFRWGNYEVFTSCFLWALSVSFLMQVVWFLANDSLNFTGRGRQGRRGEGRKNHGYFWEMGMLRLWTMRGGFQHTFSRAWLKSSLQVAWIKVKICVLMPVEGAENAIFTSYSCNVGKAFFCQAWYYLGVNLV